jgi:hypothetical protein
MFFYFLSFTLTISTIQKEQTDTLMSGFYSKSFTSNNTTNISNEWMTISTFVRSNKVCLIHIKYLTFSDMEKKQ